MNNTDILLKHPSNRVQNNNESSSTNKAWAKQYESITKKQLKLRNTFHENGAITPDWSPLVPENPDDQLRRSQQSFESNTRSKWVLDNEDDMTIYFQQEIVAPVLSKFAKYPPIYHLGKSSSGRGGVFVDSRFLWNHQTIAIGEYKRNIFDVTLWENGKFEKDGEQRRLSQEIRGYATINECPQIYLFDGQFLVLFQFRAPKLAHLATCDVDCWIFPRLEADSKHPGYPLRDALYRFLVQAYRRVASESIPSPTIGQVPSTRAFYSGEPLWLPQRQRTHPHGYYRITNEYGVFIWKYNNSTVYGDDGSVISDSIATWRSTQQSTMYTSDDIYSAD